MADRWLLAEPGTIVAGADVELEPGECHHAAAVLRLRSGDEVVLADGRGTVAVAVLRELTRGRGRAEVVAARRVEPSSPAGLELIHGVLAGRGMDWAVQKAVEVGVATLWPVVAGRSQLSVKAASGRMEHWRRIARQALKQCHRAWEMALVEPVPLDDVYTIDQVPGAVADPAGLPAWQVPDHGLERLLVGPEGGLLPAELATANRRGWVSVQLGPHILRAETAAVVGAAVLAAERARRSADRTGPE